MSKKINSFGITRLLVATHYQFHDSVNELLTADAVTAAKLGELAPRYKAELKTLQTIINRKRGTELTLEIEALDRDRDGMLGELFTIIDHAATSKLPARKVAGEKLKLGLSQYRGIAGNELNKETAQITGLIRDLQKDEFFDAIQALYLAALIDSLERTNNKVRELIDRRATLYGTRAAAADVDTATQRRVVDDLYHAIVEKVNAVALLEPGAKVNALVDDINGRVIEFRKVISQMRAGGTGLEKGTGNRNPGTTDPEEFDDIFNE